MGRGFGIGVPAPCARPGARTLGSWPRRRYNMRCVGVPFLGVDLHSSNTLTHTHQVWIAVLRKPALTTTGQFLRVMPRRAEERVRDAHGTASN